MIRIQRVNFYTGVSDFWFVSIAIRQVGVSADCGVSTAGGEAKKRDRTFAYPRVV